MLNISIITYDFLLIPSKEYEYEHEQITMIELLSWTRHTNLGMRLEPSGEFAFLFYWKVLK